MHLAESLKHWVGSPDWHPVPASHFILLIEDERANSDALAASLVRLGVEPIRAADLDEAVATVKSKQYSIRGVLIPASIDGKQIKAALSKMRDGEYLIGAMAYGKCPEPDQRVQLQRAGVLLALWDGFDEGILRFQVNRLVAIDADFSPRNSHRAPTHTPIRMLIGGREKTGVLYSISEGGCFIETPKASMEGANLRLVFCLGGVDYTLDGIVAFSNVPGNLQRPNLPLGMGVAFEETPDEVRWKLGDFIRERMEALEV